MYFETIFSPEEIEIMRNGGRVETREKNGVAHVYRMGALTACPICGGEVRDVTPDRRECPACGTVFVPAPCNGGTVFIQAKDVNVVTPYGGK